MGPSTSLGGGVETCTAALSATRVRGLFQPRPSGPKLVMDLGRSITRPEFGFYAGGLDLVWLDLLGGAQVKRPCVGQRRYRQTHFKVRLLHGVCIGWQGFILCLYLLFGERRR